MKAKSVFICNQCGNETPRWQGQCPACGAWNSIVEFEDKKPASPKASVGPKKGASAPKKLRELDASDRQIRFSTGLGELDRVLGGGGVKGSLVLVGGAPGIGKSTLLLQICSFLGKTQKILYVSGEESEQQLKMRADRLRVESENLYVLSETNLDAILEAFTDVNPDILIADEILSVGDFLFQQKCEQRMQELMSGGTTVILVSHSIDQIERMCNKVAWLDHGHLRRLGPTAEITAEYRKFEKKDAMPAKITEE